MFQPPTKARQTLIIAILTLLAYGLLLPFTGFYWDDWPFAWIAHFLGPAEFIPAFLPFRPFLAPIFYITTSIIPIQPLAWQVFALLIRFLIGVAAWWMFTQIFPKRTLLAYCAALLMLIYPGYSQHWVALTHINQELIPLLFYLFSFGYTFKALRTASRTDTIIALLLQICGIFPTEYFFGIEGLRFLLLLSIFSGTFPQRFLQALKIWLPYLLIWVLNAAWLFYYYRFGPYDSYAVSAAQSPDLLYFLTQALDALWKSGFYIWIQILALAGSSITAPASLLAFGLAALTFFFLRRNLLRSAQTDEATEAKLAVYLIFSGVIGILLGRLPSLAANLPLTLQSSFDRFMISIMPGSVLFLLGIMELLVKNHRTRIVLFSALIALGVGQQFFNANIFRRDWQNQGEIYWQMAWRMPALEPNTLLLTHQMPIDYETDNSFTAPINWMYAPNYTKSDLPYMLLYTEKRIGGSTLPALEPGIDIRYPYRTVDFISSTSKAVVIYKPQHGCLRVLDPTRGDLEAYSHLPDPLTNAIPLSDTARILSNSSQLARPPFFSEPEYGWCYYHAKISLANQLGDYETAQQLAAEALDNNLQPEDPREWLVFIEAYAISGKVDRAVILSEQMLTEDKKTLKAVCAVWEQIQAQSPEGSVDGVMSARLALGCDP